MEQCHHLSFSFGSLCLVQSEEGRKAISVMAQEFSLCLRWTLLPYSYSHGIILDSGIALLGSQRTIWTLNCYPTWMKVTVQPTGFYSFLLRSSMLSCLSSFIPGSVGDLFCSQFSHLFLSNSVLDRLVQIFTEETVCHSRGQNWPDEMLAMTTKPTIGT